MPSDSAITLCAPGFAVVVTCERRGALDWLAEFVGPWLVVADPPAEPPGLEVELSLDLRRWRTLRRSARQMSAEAHEIACFVTDTRVIRHPVVLDPNGRRWIRDDELNVLYGPADKGARISIVAARDDAAARVALMRVVRESWMVARRRAGAAVLHAAAADLGGMGVAIAGPKRSGKTTTLLHLLLARDARFVSNDRLSIWLDGREAPLAEGIPTVIALRAGTIALMPRLAARLAEDRARFERTIAELGRDRGREPSPGDDRDLSPAQLARVTGRPAQASVRLRAILFPVSETAGPAWLEPLAPETAARELAACRLAAAFPGASPEAMIPVDVPAGDPAREVAGIDTLATIGIVARMVPAFRIRVDPGLLPSQRDAERLWRALA